ncbi:hypothetical protein Tco_0564273 [Tanacetum coccineum]
MEVTAQAANIKDLKAQIKQLKKKARPGRNTFKSVPTVHKDLAFDDLDDAMDYMETEDAHDEGTVKDSKETRVSTEDQVSTDKLKVSTDKPNKGIAELNEGTAEPKDRNSDESAAPTTVFRDDETIAQFLVTMSQNKTKQKGVEIKEIKDTDRPRTTTERSILTLKPLLKIDPKDKGKKVLEEKVESYDESKGVNEAEKKFKMLANDEEISIKVQEEWKAEEEKKKLTRFLLRSFKKKREKFTIEQRAKFLHDTIAAQRRFLAQQRSEAIRNKLPIRNQLRNQMMTYLKYVGGYRHAQLNKKKFEEIQVMYENVKRANENFIPIGSTKDEKLIEKMNEKAAGMDKEEVSEEPESTKVKAKIEEPKENIRKRSRRRLKMKAPKRYPIINWETKFYDYGHFGRELIYYRVFRDDGSLRWIKTFSEMIKFFDRMDLVEIHSLVMKRFETTPPEGIDLLLWGYLRIIFESKEDDELWKNQEEWKLQSWIFYENCKVHVLRLEDGTEINMLAERRYPLTKNTLERMMDLKLTVVSDDDTVFDLLRVDIDQVHQNGDLKIRSVWIHPPGLQDDDPYDDAHHEGENDAKRQKMSEHGTYVSGESSSGQVNESKPVVQSCQRDPKAHALSLVNQDLLYLKKGSSGPEKIVMSLHKFPVVIFPDDDIEERTTYGKNPHAKIFYIKKQKEPIKPKEIIARRANGSIVSIIESDYKNLNKNDIEDMYLPIVNGKYMVLNYIDNTERKESERHQEVHKFCDATLKRVLEWLKSYNNDVKHGYVTLSLSNEDVKYVQLFKEEIEEWLKHHDQMRRWEMYMNERPLGSRRERPE